MPDAPPHLTTYRVVFALVGIMVPLTGVLPWSEPLAYDPAVARAMLGGGSLALLAGTWTSPWVRQYARRLLMAVGASSTAWFAWMAVQHGLTNDDVIGLVPLVCVFPMLVDNRVEAMATTAFVFFTTLAVAIATPEPAFPPSTFVALFSALTIGVAVQSVSRSRAEQALATLASELEGRVKDRTVDLRAALHRAETEARERREAEGRALRASRAKSLFFARMSHELRTPLNAVHGYAELVHDELSLRDTDETDTLADLEHISNASTHLLGLIDDLLEHTRLETEELALRMVALDLREVVTETLEALPTEGLRREVLDADPDPIAVRADRHHLQEVVRHLVANAAGAARATIRIAATRAGDRIGLTVGDDGEGIAPHQLDGFFDRHLDELPLGQALGLARTRWLVEGMGGHVEVHSAPGEGSAFTIWLHAAEPSITAGA